MATTQHFHQRALVALAAVFAALASAGPAYSYGWPVKPFHQQHPVRGLFGDPRIGEGGKRQFHFGVDVSAPNGTPVYATISGRISLLHSDVVEITGAAGVEFSYWHVIPTVRPGSYAVAYRTMIGRIEKPWAHVHFSEAHYGRYVNPLRAGAMGPYADHQAPVVRAIQAESAGAPVPLGAATQTIDLVAEAYDRPPLLVPAPWSNLPVMPALVRSRIVGPQGPVTKWQVAVDFRETIPTAGFFGSVFAKWTRQNHAHRPGRYRIYLMRGLRTERLQDGTYRVEVIASDIRGNSSRVEAELDVANRGLKWRR
jgi:hypothetical protein